MRGTARSTELWFRVASEAELDLSPFPVDFLPLSEHSLRQNIFCFPFLMYPLAIIDRLVDPRAVPHSRSLRQEIHGAEKR